jgi:phosphatidylserine/phosphatidylglycerophosphate/cardiolipin synthase-like enzyme
MAKKLLPLLFAWGLDFVSLNAQQGPKDLHPYFSPNGGCTEAVVNALGAAQKSILVQAYSFTSAPIAKALVDAKKRGVDVQVILDKSQKSEHYSSATFLSNEGIPTYIDAAHKIAHNKLMVIDGDEVITGSFNFTKSAEDGNAENLLLINHAPELAKTYTANWKAHLAHSDSYTSGQSAIPSASIPAASETTPTNTVSTAASATVGYWLSHTGKRHNSSYRYYHNCKGHECGPNDGKPCKVCGG